MFWSVFEIVTHVRVLNWVKFAITVRVTDLQVEDDENDVDEHEAPPPSSPGLLAPDPCSNTAS